MTMFPKLRRASDKHLIYAASGVAGMAAEIIRLKSRISELERNARTPGTYIGCIACGFVVGSDRALAECGEHPLDCPIRAAREGEK